MKKVMVSLLVVALVIGCFAGCGKKEKGDLQQQAVSRDYVYKQEVISYNGSGTAPSGLIQIGDKVYGYSYEWREMDGAVTPRADIEGGGNTEKEAEAEDVDTATEETVAEPEPGTEDAAEDIAESYSSMIFMKFWRTAPLGKDMSFRGHRISPLIHLQQIHRGIFTACATCMYMMTAVIPVRICIT